MIRGFGIATLMGRQLQSDALNFSCTDRYKPQMHWLIEVTLVLLAFSGVPPLRAQGPITFQYVYDDAGQLQKVMDSTGVTIEYVYDPVGNILEVKRSSVSPGALTIFSFTPAQGG